ncbi:ABC transporter ATP-binding protein [Streptomyces hainanensis]|uniref:ABC transporter ATP-binding protein n=1 Tax=Streptomyces hainanensis TaxID=402648 RepID=A0A4R4THW9_9ACTN|nr:ABC transporter ATP-binding protein [Streptomyces hainanensis]TDC73949.1 ABC transporter ATP-binding protein [Streptomyces hainanensis]
MTGGVVTGRDVLRRAVVGQRRRLVGSALLGAGHQAGEALTPMLIGVIVDHAIAEGDSGALVLLLGALGVCYLVLSFSFRFGSRIGERAAETAAHELRVDLVRRVLHPAGGAERGRLPGALASVATEDARRVGVVLMALVLGFGALMGLLVGSVALLRISLPLGLLVLLGTPVLLWLGHLLSKPLERRSATEQEAAALASGVAADLVSGLRVLKGLGAETAATDRYRRISEDSLAATLRAARAEAGQQGVTLAVTGVFVALVALVGGRFAASGDISLGELVSALGLALFLLTPFQTLAWVNTELAQGRASAARVADVLAAPWAVEPGGEPPAAPVRGELAVRALDHDAVRALDLTTHPGELLGLAVADPAHADTLLRCLGRETDPAGGTLLLDGTALTALDPAALRAAVLVAPHDADLFSGTVADNVPGAAQAAALAAAGADALGADTQAGEGGRALSGGQRQRVALARALADDPPVLVLHDPTTAVDAVTEARIAAGIRDLRHGRTTVLVTTSPTLLAIADRVLLLDEAGRVTAEGRHADLLRDHPDYQRLVLS